MLKWYREMDLHLTEPAKDLFLNYVMFARSSYISKKMKKKDSVYRYEHKLPQFALNP